MSLMTSASGAIDLIKQSYRKLLKLGEGINGSDFRVVFDHAALKDHEFLVQTAQIPACKREVIETKGPHGVGFVQQGNFLNSGETNGTFKEVITGLALKGIREVVRTKAYFNVTMGLVSETMKGSDVPTTVVLEDCWLESDALDVGVEDGAQILKPSFILHYNWVTWLDANGEVMDWA